MDWTIQGNNRRRSMEGFSFSKGQLLCERVPAMRAARKLGTPLYLYSRQALTGRIQELQQAFAGVPTTVCYSVKANSNLSLLKAIAEVGAGFDIVSGGELFRVMRATGSASKVVFAGVGKTADEIAFALESNIWMFNVECATEIDDIARLARRMRKIANISLRINPDVAADTHHKITTGKKENKFGLDAETAGALAKQVAGTKSLRLIGLHAHIGSQILDPVPHRLAMEKLAGFAQRFAAQGIHVEYLNMGGGLGIRYRSSEKPPPADAFAAGVVPIVKAHGKKLIIEPGRYVAGNAAILLTRVVRVKKTSHGKTFVICDAAMNDLVRPSMYDAYHFIWPVRSDAPVFLGGKQDDSNFPRVDVVGPICESGDYMAKDRPLPPVAEGDILAVFGAGAYGMAMSSNYNSRRRAAEAMADGSNLLTIRVREDYTDLIHTEEGCI
jgi:diaminopimelate decarboxylase